MDDATTTTAPPAAAAPVGNSYDDYSGPAIRWDDLQIQSESITLPEDLRADYVWLKGFVRDRCNRDINALVEMAKRLGIYHDKTTWSKILRGRLYRDSRGDSLASPVLALDKVKRAVEAIRTNTRNEALRGKVPFVETTVWDSIENYLDLKRSRDRVNRFGMVVGPTGSGKTAAFKEYVRRNNHGATWWFEAPAGGSLTEFLNRLAACSGLSAQTSPDKKRTHLLKVVQESKAIIVDNAQDLYRAGKSDLAAFNFLRQLQDETNCCIILSITPTFEKELVAGMLAAYFEQFVGRSGGVRKWLKLPSHPPEEDVLLIAEAFGLRDAKKSLKQLVAISREPGRVRILFDDLQDAKRLAVARKEALTIDHLIEIRGED